MIDILSDNFEASPTYSQKTFLVAFSLKNLQICALSAKMCCVQKTPGVVKGSKGTSAIHPRSIDGDVWKYVTCSLNIHSLVGTTILLDIYIYIIYLEPAAEIFISMTRAMERLTFFQTSQSHGLT